MAHNLELQSHLTRSRLALLGQASEQLARYASSDVLEPSRSDPLSAIPLEQHQMVILPIAPTAHISCTDT